VCPDDLARLVDHDALAVHNDACQAETEFAGTSVLRLDDDHSCPTDVASLAIPSNGDQTLKTIAAMNREAEKEN